MKRFLWTVMMVAVSGSLCFAQSYPAKTTASSTAKSMAGKIQSMTQADAVKGTKSELVITAAGSPMTFLVKSGTTIYDANGKALMLKDLKKDEEVKVNYKTSPEGVMEATSIYQMK